MDVPEIDVDQLAERHGQGALIIDVRNPDEYEAGHVPGARLIPLGEVPHRVDEVPDDQPVFVICAVGGRSRRACEVLQSHGRDVTNVAGGTKAWVATGRPTTVGGAP